MASFARLLPLLLIVLTFAASARATTATATRAQLDDLDRRMQMLESAGAADHARLDAVDNRLRSTEANANAAAASFLVLFLVGTFCALWAQNTNRNPWLWFFCGAFFNILSLLVLLYKNAHDPRRRAPLSSYC